MTNSLYPITANAKAAPPSAHLAFPVTTGTPPVLVLAPMLDAALVLSVPVLVGNVVCATKLPVLEVPLVFGPFERLVLEAPEPVVVAAALRAVTTTGMYGSDSV